MHKHSASLFDLLNGVFELSVFSSLSPRDSRIARLHVTCVDRCVMIHVPSRSIRCDNHVRWCMLILYARANHSFHISSPKLQRIVCFTAYSSHLHVALFTPQTYQPGLVRGNFEKRSNILLHSFQRIPILSVLQCVG